MLKVFHNVAVFTARGIIKHPSITRFDLLELLYELSWINAIWLCHQPKLNLACTIMISNGVPSQIGYPSSNVVLTPP